MSSSTWMLLGNSSRPVNSGVMSPLRVDSTLRAASAPLNQSRLGMCPRASALLYLVASRSRSILISASGAAAGIMRYNITTACARPESRRMSSVRSGAARGRVRAGDAGRYALCG